MQTPDVGIRRRTIVIGPSTSAGTPIEASYLQECSPNVALVRVLDRVVALLAALEARPSTESPLVACHALLDAQEGGVLTIGEDEMLVMAVLTQSPSLAGRLMWRIGALTGRLAQEFARRMGLEEADLRSQLLATSVMAAISASIRTWMQDPTGPSPDQLLRCALTDLAMGLG